MAPEPIQGGRLGPGGGGDDEDLSPPSGLTLGPLLSSSEDELDHNDTENSQVEYLPLSQDHDPEDDPENDQNTLSGLMQALTTHGPNVIPEEEEGGEEGGGEGGRRREGAELEVTPQASVLVHESAWARDTETRRELTAVWSCCPTQVDRLELDGSRMEEIKSAMASITLPPSATPAWAQNLSDEDWKDQIASLLSRQTNK